jgi:hypothetical protein
MQVVKVVPCVIMRITILKYQNVYKKLYLKMLVDNVILKVINVLKDIIY